MEKKTFWGFTLPSVFVMVLLMVVPLGTTIWLSFNRLLLRDLNNPEWIGWANYSEVLADPDFWAAVRWTLIYVAITVPLQMALGLAVALLLDRVARGRALYMAALLTPFIVTPVVGTLLFKDLFERGGLIAYLWEVATGEPFLVTSSNVKLLIITQSVWYVMPFMMISFFAGLQSMPQERLEAAAIDGAGFFRNLWHITIPHLNSIIGFVVLIAIMDAYRVYDSVFVFAGRRFQEAQTLQVYNVAVATQADIGRVGKGNAIAILNIIGIFAVLIPFLYRSYKEQIAERL